MPRMIGQGLSRREREILEALHRLGKASVADVQAALPDSPSYSSVRTFLRILEEKGHIGHEEEGKRYLYFPRESGITAARNALRSVLHNFFGDRPENAVRMFLTDQDARLSDEELENLAALIEEARRKRQEDAP